MNSAINALDVSALGAVTVKLTTTEFAGLSSITGSSANVQLIGDGATIDLETAII